MTTASQEHPLSYGQQALWFIQQLSPSSTAYNFVFAARIRSRVDVAALRRALQGLLDRHEALRTTYAVRGGRPVQVVHERAELFFETIDAAGWSQELLDERLIESAYRPFDLERGPILRTGLFTQSAEEHLFLLAAHHSVIDFLSLVLVMDELGELYRAATAGEAPALPPASVQYADFARWQHELLSGADGARLWAYWSRQLAGSIPPIDLPFARPRPPRQTYRGASQTFKLGARLTEQLKAVARMGESSLFATLLAAWQVLLHRYTGLEDIAVGCPTSGRHPEFARVVGYLVNPVVVRANLANDPLFSAFLVQVNANVVAAWEHQDYPFALLVERLQPARDPSRSPLFQTLFVLHSLEDQGIIPLLFGESGIQANLGGLLLESSSVDQQAAMLDLSMTMVEAGGAVTAYLQYNTDLFDAAVIARLIAQFEALLAGIAADPARRVSALPLLADAEHEQLLVEPKAPAAGAAQRPLQFSLFYFASDSRATRHNKYKLLIEGAKFADRHGFSAVWTPERHFHAFGGLYPNPSVTSAAVAAVTERVQIRAGSVVLPLHHPVRVAEEWSVVDNLSDGRAGIAVASGWHANDFIFEPENYARRREVMVRDIEIIRRLWRGETLAFPASDGRMAEVSIWPQPIQPDLPIWVSAFGSPETFRVAGQIGANVLTHLVGQSAEELARKVKVYRDARREQGLDPQGGSVAVMLHTFIGEDIDAVRAIVREPFLNYLKTSVDLARDLAQSTGMNVDPSQYTEADIDAFLSVAFERYFTSSALFGTPTSCDALLERLTAAGVDEIACLIDFGIDLDLVMSNLSYLRLVKERWNAFGTMNASTTDHRPPTNDESFDSSVVLGPSSRAPGTARDGEQIAAPQDATERAIAAIWQAVLRREAIGVHDSFFALGGDDAALEQARDKLRATFERDVSAEELAGYPTISAWARLFRQRAGEAPSFEPVQGRAETRRSAMQRHQSARQSSRAARGKKEDEYDE